MQSPPVNTEERREEKKARKSLQMSKLSFRARQLDPAKPMPIYLAEELPDMPEYSAINRAVPQMPSGMEKEEESVSEKKNFCVLTWRPYWSGDTPINGARFNFSQILF